jgi:hypothetical protein
MSRSGAAALSVREDLVREDLSREDLRDRFHRRADDDRGEIKTEANQVHSRASGRHGNLPLNYGPPWGFMVNNCLTGMRRRKICAAEERFMSLADAWEICRHRSNADVT